VPTLFLLPGILILGVRGLVRPPKPSDRIAPNSLGFWIVAIMCSVGLSLLYTQGMRCLGYSRDLTERFGLADVAWIWAISLVIGWFWGKYALNEDASEKKEVAAAVAGRTLDRQDDPLAVLQKLLNLTAHWPLSPIRFKNRKGFLVEPDASGRQWFLPQARPRESSGGDPAAAAPRAALSELLSKTPPPTLAELVQALTSEAMGPLRPFEWLGGAGPEPLGKDDETDSANPRPYVAL
jgi:hypothetical protein